MQTESRALKSKLTTVRAEHEAAIEKAENLSNAMDQDSDLALVSLHNVNTV